MADSIPSYILDSFALLSYLQAEAGGPTIRGLLEQARDDKTRLAMSLINLGETYYLMYREQGAQHANDMLDDFRDLPITLYDATEARILAAARIKAQYPLAYADAFAIALAQELKATLITGDPEFRKVESLVQILWLPTEPQSEAKEPGHGR
jgi:ribonuclease VapC